MRRSNWLVVFCFLVLLTAACSSSSTPPTSQAPDLAETEELIKELILPVIQIIGLLDPFTMFGQPLAANGGGVPCPVTPCFEGNVTVCEVGAVTTATFNCTTEGGIVFSNTIVITETQAKPFEGQAVVDGFSITAGGSTFTLMGTVDVALGEGTSSIGLDITVSPINGILEGGLNSSLEKGCLTQTTDDLTFGIFSVAAIALDGSLTYCPREAWPTGVRALAIVQIGNDLLYTTDMTDSGERTATVDVTDLSDGTLLVECEVDLNDEVNPAICMLPAEEG